MTTSEHSSLTSIVLRNTFLSKMLFKRQIVK